MKKSASDHLSPSLNRKLRNVNLDSPKTKKTNDLRQASPQVKRKEIVIDESDEEDNIYRPKQTVKAKVISGVNSSVNV